MAIANDTGFSALSAVELGGFQHRWLAGTFLAGTAGAPQLKAFAVALVGLYDHLPRLYGPPVMTGPDYKIRRLVADQLLTTVDVASGPVRVGEGGHAAMATTLARSLGASDAELGAAAAAPALVAAADDLVSTMFEPPAWVSMAAIAQTESAHAADLSSVRDALCGRYHVDPGDAALFDAPPLYPPALAEQVGTHLGTPFDDALFSYYRARIHLGWQSCWGACFDAAASA